MKFKEMINISYVNITSRIKTSLKLFISFVILSLLLILFISYNLIVKYEYVNIQKNYLSANFIRLMNISEVNNDIKKEIELISAKNELYYKSFTYHGSDQYDITVNGINTNFTESVSIYSEKNGNVYSKNDEISFYNKYNDRNILNGRTPENQNEIVISYELYLKLNIDISLILDSNIILKNRGDIILDNVVIVGVLDKYFSSLEGKEGGIQIYTSLYKNQNTQEFMDVYYSSFEEGKSALVKISQLYDANNLIYYAQYLSQNISFLSKQNYLVNEIMKIIGGMIMIVVLVSVFFTLFYLTKQKKIYYGIVQFVGMKKSHAVMISILELLMISISSLTLSSVLSAIILNMAFKLMSITVGVALKIRFIDLLISVGTTVIILLFLIIIMIYIQNKWIRKNQVTELLK